MGWGAGLMSVFSYRGTSSTGHEKYMNNKYSIISK